MLEHLGHGAIVEVTQMTARCGDDVRRHHRATGTRSNGRAGEGNVGEIGRSSHANDGPPRRRKGYDAPDRRLVRPETGWPGHETELSSLRYRAAHWIRIRGAPESKSEERTLEEGWRGTGKGSRRDSESSTVDMSPAEVQVDSLPSSLPFEDAFGVLAGGLIVRA